MTPDEARLAAEKIVQEMDRLLCSGCKQYKKGCTPEQIHICTEGFMSFLNMFGDGVKDVNSPKLHTL